MFLSCGNSAVPSRRDLVQNACLSIVTSGVSWGHRMIILLYLIEEYTYTEEFETPKEGAKIANFKTRLY